MTWETGLPGAARLFKVLGNESRLRLMLLLEESPRTVGALAEAADLSQPLVSQHLRTLRQTGLVTSARRGKTIVYRVADHHVTRVVADALAHVEESAAPARDAEANTPERTPP